MAAAWLWSVDGREAVHGTVERGYTESGEHEAEHAAEVLDWLVHGPGTPIWDNLDTAHGFTVSIAPKPR